MPGERSIVNVHNIGTEAVSHPICVFGAGSTRVRQGPTNAASTIGGLSLIDQGVLRTSYNTADERVRYSLCPVPNSDKP